MYVVHRTATNPILSPTIEHPGEMIAFNPNPVTHNGARSILYRAQGRPDPLLSPPTGISSVRIADEVAPNEYGNPRPFITPSEDWDKYGCEDPRATFFEGRFYTFYTALSNVPFNASNIKIGCAVSDDLQTVAEKHLITPFNAKAMALFPERINGKVTVILSAHTDEPPTHIAIAQAESIEELWSPDFWKQWHETQYASHQLPLVRKDKDHVEVGAVPLKTKDGWLVIYSYIKDYFGGDRTFGIEAFLLDSANPLSIVGKTEYSILVPEEAYELYGMIPNIIFPSGASVENDTLHIFYGAADTVCAQASLHLPDLLDSMKPGARSKSVVRSTENPILKPIKEHAWESKLVFNTGAVELGGVVYLLYRAMSDDNTSVIGYAKSTDGIHFVRDSEPCYIPRAEFELKKGSPTGNSGCEDARVTHIDGRLYISYTAYNGVLPPQVAVSSISEKDFLEKRWDAWTMPVLASPSGVDDKDACILPEKVNGEYMFLHRINGRICADLVPTLDFEHPVNRCVDVMGARKGTWESEKVGIAGVPIHTEKGWLMIYHAVSKEKGYSLGIALLDLTDPTLVLARGVEPLMVVETDYERVGEVPNVVFSNGHVVRGDTLFIYYGGADSVIGVATCSFSQLLAILTRTL